MQRQIVRETRWRMQQHGKMNKSSESSPSFENFFSTVLNRNKTKHKKKRKQKRPLIRRTRAFVCLWREFKKKICLLQPPACNSISRRRRDTVNDDTVKGVEGLDGGTPATIEVYSGLYVNEASDVASKSDFTDDVFRERVRRCS